MHNSSAIVLFKSVILPFLNAVITLSTCTDKRYGYLDLCIFLLKKEGLSICDLVTLKKCLSQNSLNTMLQKTSFVKTRTLYLFDKCLICFRISGISGITIIPMNVTITSAPRLPMACDEARGSEAEIFFRAFDDRALLLRSSSLLSFSIHAWSSASV